MKPILFFFLFVFIGIFVISQTNTEEFYLKTTIDKSGPYIGINHPRDLGFNGSGIKIAVIDTGVDHLHPDLFGFGPEGKIVGGYNFVEEGKMPLDINGHGTQVAGIIAADGNLTGIAPNAQILAYKVSQDGEAVASELIIKAIDMAIEDGADIINISLGVNKTNSKLDQGVSKAVQQGIVVVVAAGNDGPEMASIGSPGINANAITVGATYNNITSSLVSTLEVEGKQFQVLPMVGTSKLEDPISGEILFGGFGKEENLRDRNYQGAIILAERGSDVEGELVYFSHKEGNAANVGASAVLVYNNEPGVFLGELYHEFNEPNYEAQIPVVSISREDGLRIKDLLENKTSGILNIFYNPDFVAFFSSRGPVSPFYIKPDLVAPGAFVNTTLSNGGYNFTSGTSFAAPHVSGTIALMLEKNPTLTPSEIKSILVTTTDLVSDPFGTNFPIDVAGSGRLNATKAFDANLIIEPSYLVFYLSGLKDSHTETIKIKTIKDEIPQLDVKFEGPDFIEFGFEQKNNQIQITAKKIKEKFEKFDATMIIQDKDLVYRIPIIGQITNGSLAVIEQNGKLHFEITHPSDWTYAKISVINKETGKFDTTSATPNRKPSIPVYENGKYWIEVNIQQNGNTLDAFETVVVTSATENNYDVFSFLDIPQRPIIILASIVIVISLIGLKLRK